MISSYNYDNIIIGFYACRGLKIQLWIRNFENIFGVTYKGAGVDNCQPRQFRHLETLIYGNKIGDKIMFSQYFYLFYMRVRKVGTNVNLTRRGSPLRETDFSGHWGVDFGCWQFHPMGPFSWDMGNLISNILYFIKKWCLFYWVSFCKYLW